ncbi:MAG: DNA repair protein RadA [Rhodobacteraceae bacterium]|nr:DNA repair protein RadA [Paracoccaceae bacterium]MBR28692.1 DNA repair protein RadA [Paracoccaceae bacterium]
MARSAPSFTCAECGAVHGKWAGRCDACGAWNSITEDAGLGAALPKPTGPGKNRIRRVPLVALAGSEPAPARMSAGVGELDRVLGGGLATASAVLVGGDPGIGKSTLLLQATAAFARQGAKAIYVSGEEATGQIRMRAARLGLQDSPVQLAAETGLREILATLEEEKPDVVVVDSIQTMWLDSVDSAPGSVSQVRAAAHALTAFAKTRGAAVILVGHVTKEGQIAGPRVVEHMVDTVLYFEGERGHPFRILRAVKNRFGPSDEIGVFEMTARGLAQVSNPSALFLSERGRASPGTVVFAGVEGTRPLLVEIQALVGSAAPGSPRRAVVGWDSGRLAMILAVLEARCGVALGGRDVYLNVAGGLRVSEPAADLAVAAALLSAAQDRALEPDTVVFGEISLSGAVRPAPQTDTRLREAAKLGFNVALAPSQVKPGANSGMTVHRIEDLSGLVARLLDAEA